MKIHRQFFAQFWSSPYLFEWKLFLVVILHSWASFHSLVQCWASREQEKSQSGVNVADLLSYFTFRSIAWRLCNEYGYWISSLGGMICYYIHSPLGLHAEIRTLNLRRPNLSKGKEFPFLIFTIMWVCSILPRDPNIPVTQIKASLFVSLIVSHQHFVESYETGIHSIPWWICNLIPFPVWECYSIWRLWHSWGQLKAGSMWHWTRTKAKSVIANVPMKMIHRILAGFGTARYPAEDYSQMSHSTGKLNPRDESAHNNTRKAI
jgi:hypothetical protein